MGVRNYWPLLLVRKMELFDVVLTEIVRVSPLGQTDFRISENLYEILSQILNVRILLFQLIDRNCIWNSFNQTTSRARSNNIERLQPELQLVRLKDSLKLLNQL